MTLPADILAVIKVTAVNIKEKYLVVGRGGAAYVRELVHGSETPVSINITRVCVMDCTVQ